ncbi:MAG: hypothetical protein NTZ00_05565, partial [Bacteroidetes bacterium]|nr:hypothetical protein [Bacteroidota bacterium]
MTSDQNTSNNPINNSSEKSFAIGSAPPSPLHSSKSSPWLIVWAGISTALPILLLYIYSCKPEAFS